MGIRFQCPNGHSLNVKSFLAGKRGVCPTCGVKLFIPQESGGVAEAVRKRRSGPKEPVPAVSRTDSADALLEAPDAGWYVRPPSGGQFGPAEAEVMRHWIDEGRVTGDSLIWREGWADWKEASTTFSHLASESSVWEESDLMEVSLNTSFDKNVSKNLLSGGSRRNKKQLTTTIVVIMIFLIVMLFVGLIYVLSRQNFSEEEQARLQASGQSRVSVRCELT